LFKKPERSREFHPRSLPLPNSIIYKQVIGVNIALERGGVKRGQNTVPYLAYMYFHLLDRRNSKEPEPERSGFLGKYSSTIIFVKSIGNLINNSFGENANNTCKRAIQSHCQADKPPENSAPGIS
jgi:hypothetical protein